MNYKYPPSNEIASPTELRKLYDRAVTEIKEYKRMAKEINQAARNYHKERDEAQKSVRISNNQVLTLKTLRQKQQKATQEASRSTMWSGAAAIAVTILYETWKVAGFPGGNKWMVWWNHEAVYGILMWLATIFFGQMYKISRGKK